MSSDAPDTRRQRIKFIVAVSIFVVAGGVAWYTLGGESVEQRASDRMFICAECHQPFEYTLQMGDITPVKCGKCGKQAAYPAEACYWAKGPDGVWKAKLEPTFVLVKKRMDPETTEKTYCPDCGQEVVGHNPLPPEELLRAAGWKDGL